MGIFVERHDDGEGPDLLLVHGFLSSRAQWRPNLESLKRFCRPLIVELWGHGRSPAPNDPQAYGVGRYVEIFDEIRESFGIERWFVCGQSFGAGLTLAYSLTHPKRVIGQVFTNSLSALSPPGALGGKDDYIARGDALERGGIPAIEALPYHPRFARRFPEDVKQEMLEDVARISPRGVANGVRHTLSELSVIDRIGDTSVPTLLIQGTWEKRFQPLAEEARRRLKTLQCIELPGGHSINIEAARQFSDAVYQFLRNPA